MIPGRLVQLRNSRNHIIDALGRDGLQSVAGWGLAEGGAVDQKFVEGCCDALHRVLGKLRQASAVLEVPPTAGPAGLVAAHQHGLFNPPLPPGIFVEFAVTGEAFVVNVFAVVQTGGGGAGGGGGGGGGGMTPRDGGPATPRTPRSPDSPSSRSFIDFSRGATTGNLLGFCTFF